MKEIEELILLELKKQLFESSDNERLDDLISTSSSQAQPAPSWDDSTGGRNLHFGDESDGETGNNDASDNEDDTEEEWEVPSVPPSNEDSSDNQNQDKKPEALKLYQHRSQKHLDSIKNYIIGYTKFLTKIKKRRKQIDTQSPQSEQEQQEDLEEDNENTSGEQENDQTQLDAENPPAGPIEEAESVLKTVAEIAKDMESFINFANLKRDDDDFEEEEPFKSYTLQDHMTLDKYTIRWVNSYKKRAPNAKMETLKQIAGLAPLMDLPELADVIENHPKLLDKASNVVAKIVNVFRTKMHDIKSYEKIDRLLTTAPVKVEGGLYVVARYILKALENYFYNKFEEFQSGKKRSIQSALENETLQGLERYYTMKTKNLFRDWIVTATDEIKDDNTQGIIDKWKEDNGIYDNKREQLANSSRQTDLTDEQLFKLEQLSTILNNINKLILQIEENEKTKKILLNFLKQKAEEQNITIQESKNRQIENKLEILILEEIKRIKNG